MDEQLKSALEFSNYRQTFSIQRKTLKEKIDAKLTYGINGGIFKIDRSLLAFVQMLIDQDRTVGIPLIDANDNPVLIDDLINKGTDEPYRMFTSRAEHRTLLRQDNADLRLTEMSFKLGLAKENRMALVDQKSKGVVFIKELLSKTSIEPININDYLESIGASTISNKQRADQLLLRPGVGLQSLIKNDKNLSLNLSDYDEDVIDQTEIQIKYDTYIEKEKEMIEKINQLEDLLIPKDFNYEKINSLSNEAKQKLKKILPKTLGQASRISGVNPSDIQILMLYMGR
jgi:tRNA uridine 5-carboxymethylaminomethyl modification enzyme